MERNSASKVDFKTAWSTRSKSKTHVCLLALRKYGRVFTKILTSGWWSFWQFLLLFMLS
jgi:hypothetical protein